MIINLMHGREVSEQMISDYYGEENSRLQLQEECGELIVAINHDRRKLVNTGTVDYIARHEVMEEIADVLVMIERVASILEMNPENIASLMSYKRVRELKRIKGAAKA